MKLKTSFVNVNVVAMIEILFKKMLSLTNFSNSIMNWMLFFFVAIIIWEFDIDLSIEFFQNQYKKNLNLKFSFDIFFIWNFDWSITSRNWFSNSFRFYTITIKKFVCVKKIIAINKYTYQNIVTIIWSIYV